MEDVVRLRALDEDGLEVGLTLDAPALADGGGDGGGQGFLSLLGRPGFDCAASVVRVSTAASVIRVSTALRGHAVLSVDGARFIPAPPGLPAVRAVPVRGRPGATGDSGRRPIRSPACCSRALR